MRRSYHSPEGGDPVMAYTTELTPDYMGVVHVGTGVVTAEELLAGCRVTTALMETTENFHYEFVDLSDVTELQITEEDLEQIVAQDHLAAVFRPHAVVVIVAAREDLFATAKLWEQRVQDLGWNTHVSRKRSEALAWLKQNFPSMPAKP